MLVHKELNSLWLTLVAFFDPMHYFSREKCAGINLFLDPKQTVGQHVEQRPVWVVHVQVVNTSFGADNIVFNVTPQTAICSTAC